MLKRLSELKEKLTASIKQKSQPIVWVARRNNSIAGWWIAFFILQLTTLNQFIIPYIIISFFVFICLWAEEKRKDENMKKFLEDELGDEAGQAAFRRWLSNRDG
jgi:hypothetical protein